jgi:short-subunit dehydrogenase
VTVASQPLYGIYSASKLAVGAITEAFRSELRDRGIPIEVSLIRPTAIDLPQAVEQYYSPDVCAEAILKCAENPQRDIFVGGPAKLSAIIETFFPHVKDMVTETKMKEMKNEIDFTTMSFIKTITHSARKQLDNFRRAG